CVRRGDARQAGERRDGADCRGDEPSHFVPPAGRGLLTGVATADVHGTLLSASHAEAPGLQPPGRLSRGYAAAGSASLTAFSICRATLSMTLANCSIAATALCSPHPVA